MNLLQKRKFINIENKLNAANEGYHCTIYLVMSTNSEILAIIP